MSPVATYNVLARSSPVPVLAQGCQGWVEVGKDGRIGKWNKVELRKAFRCSRGNRRMVEAIAAVSLWLLPLWLYPSLCQSLVLLSRALNKTKLATSISFLNHMHNIFPLNSSEIEWNCRVLILLFVYSLQVLPGPSMVPAMGFCVVFFQQAEN